MVPSLLTAGISEDDAHARATSSMTMHVASASSPGPVVLLGDVRRVEPGARSASYAAWGNSPLSSTSAACGAILSVAISRMASRMSRWSSESWYRSKAGFAVLTCRILPAGSPTSAPV